MAQVDTSIYGQIRPFTMETPLAQTAQALQVAGMQQQVQEGRRRFQMEDDLSSALTDAGGDYSKASTLLAQRGRGAASISLADKASAQKKSEVEQKLKVLEAMSSDGIALDAAYRQALAANGGDQAKAMAAIQPSYNEIRARWAPQGVSLPEQFDPVKNLAGVGQAKEVATYLKSLQQTPTDLGKLMSERDALPQNDPRRAQYDAAIGEKGNPTELARLQKERDALPAGDPRRATYDRVLAGYKAGKGDTNVSVNTGPMTPGKAGATKVDEGILDNTQGLMRLDNIAAQFKPEYQTLATRGTQWWNAVKEKAGADLKAKEKKDLEEFSAYKRNAINSLNEYIKSITGAAMSEMEAQRILRGMPNPGQGIFDGDSPTEFKAKLDDAIKSTKMAVARMSYIKRNGMSLDDGKGNPVVPLDRMPEIINTRGKEIETQLKASQPGSDQKALSKAVRRQLAVEFGLSND